MTDVEMRLVAELVAIHFMTMSEAIKLVVVGTGKGTGTADSSKGCDDPA